MGRARRARKIAATAAYGGGGVAAHRCCRGGRRLGSHQGRGGPGAPDHRRAVRRLPRRQRRLRVRPRRALRHRGARRQLGGRDGHGCRPRDRRRDHRQRRRGPDRAAGAADQPRRRGCRVQRPGAPARELARGRPAARRRADHGGRQRRDAPHRAQRLGAPARADRSADPRPGVRGRRRYVSRPRHHPADPPAAALADEALVARPGRGADRRGRRGRRSHRVARRPDRARVRGVTARDVQQGPVPPVGGRLRASGRGAAAERVRRPGRLGRGHRGPAPEARRGEGVGPVAVAAGHAVKEPGTEVAPTQIAGQSRGPRGRWAVTLRRRHDEVPPRGGHPGRDRGRAGERPTTRRPRPRPEPSLHAGNLTIAPELFRCDGEGCRIGRESWDYSTTTASSSTSTFQRGSIRPATTTIVLAGRISPKISPCTDEIASTTSASPSVM